MYQYFELLPKYFPELTNGQLEKFSSLWDIYHDWNSKINVISRKDIDELFLRHVLHSLAIAKVFTLSQGANVLDVGTGGGFPGIPLSIYFPEVDFTLVDSIGKKIKVVNSAIDTLKLENARGIHMRAEESKSKFDYVVSRAVTQMPVFLGWMKGKIRKKHDAKVPNGIIYLKGGDLTEELSTISWKTIGDNCTACWAIFSSPETPATVRTKSFRTTRSGR